MDLAIGYDNFGKIINQKLNFVDKTLFIEEVFNHKATEVSVITRPRRFGKTLNLSMLHHFLAPEILGESTQHLFDGLKISAHKELCQEHQGQYPVIFITFKSVKNEHFQHAYDKLHELIVATYRHHSYLESSPKLSRQQQSTYRLIVDGKANQAQLESSLLTLTECVFTHYGKRPWLLIDEYDAPLQSGYLFGYYQEMATLFRGLLGETLKTNPYLYRSVITGILRVSKESIFSGVNNLKVYSLLNTQYSQYFGFTEEEVKELLSIAKLENHLEDIRSWYNGYQAGNTQVYNPWSIVNCIQENGRLAPYWVNTSDDKLTREIIIGSREEFKTGLEALLRGETIERPISEHMVFGDLKGNEMAAWSLFLMAGYLKVVAQRDTERGLLCTLDIPNREVRQLYGQIIEQWLANGRGLIWYSEFVERLLTGKIDLFERDLKRVLEETASYHDMTQEPEAFFHGFMLGLTVSIHYDPRYELSSNRESGYGRYDYFIFSKESERPTILLEFKRVDPVKNSDQLEEALTVAAQEALDQIDKQGYLAEAKKRGAGKILKIAIAFCGKRFVLKQSF